MVKITYYIQVSSDLMRNGNSLAWDYYNLFYQEKEKDGFYKTSRHFFEIPLWITTIDKTTDVEKLLIMRNKVDISNLIDDFVVHSKANDITIYMSALNENVNIINLLTLAIPNVKFIIGGYANIIARSNVIFKTSINVFNDYRIFKGISTVPRLALSTGCFNSCEFCSNIPDKVLAIPSSVIYKNANNIVKNLKYKLVYIDDKTFGQCYNQTMLEPLQYILDCNFIVQTHPNDINLIHFRNSGIKYVELGVEQYDNAVLRAMNKRSGTTLIDNAIEILLVNGINPIVNIITDYKHETTTSIDNTLKWLDKHKSVLYSVNVNTYVDYNNPTKSQNDSNSTFYKDVLSIATEIIKQ